MIQKTENYKNLENSLRKVRLIIPLFMLPLPVNLLCEIFNKLPKDTIILGINTSFNYSDVYEIILSSSEFPECEEGSFLPTINIDLISKMTIIRKFRKLIFSWKSKVNIKRKRSIKYRKEEVDLLTEDSGQL